MRKKVKKGENLVVAATKSAEVEARKLKEELATASHFLSEAHEELLKQKELAEKHREEGESALEELHARLATVHKEELEKLCVCLAIENEKELEDTHREFQSQSDTLRKQAF